MKVALYARVSKNDDSQDPETQLVRLRTYAKERSWDVYAEYADLSSGADAYRPQLDAMMAEARARHFDMVLIVRIDRLARSTRNLLNVVAELEERGVKLECTDQPISTNSAHGRLLLEVLGAVASFERELIRDRTKAGLARARAQGRTPGRPMLQIDMERVRKLKSEGFSLRAIARMLRVSHQTIKSRLRNEADESKSDSTRECGGLENGR